MNQIPENKSVSVVIPQHLQQKQTLMHRCTWSNLIWAVGTVWRSLCSKRMAQCIIDDFPRPDVWIGNLSTVYLGTGLHSGASVHNYRIQTYNRLSQHEWRLAVGWPALLVLTGFHVGNRLLTQNAPFSCRHLHKHNLVTYAAAPVLQCPQQLLYCQFATRCHSYRYYKLSFKALTSCRQCQTPKQDHSTASWHHVVGAPLVRLYV